MKTKILLLMMLLTGCISTIKAEQTETPMEYAVLNDGVLTLYYDLERWNRIGTVYEGFPVGKQVSWLGSSYVSVTGGWTDASFTKFVIDKSFANYKTLTSTAYWFYNRTDLESITGMEYLNTENVTDMTGMFRSCSSLKSLDVSKFNTGNVIYTSGGNSEGHGWGIFTGCSSLTSLDVSNFDTSKMISMSHMFSGCSSLTSLDLSSFNTENVTDMGNMFLGCSSLTSLDMSSFDTKNVTSMTHMFRGCSNLKTINLSSFDTRNVTNMYWMFFGCRNLTSLDLSSFNTKKIWDMRGMFSGCSSLTSLDLSSFNTENVSLMEEMFSGCSSLTTLNLNSFNTLRVEDADCMFENCTKLTKITTGEGFVTDYMTSSYAMFGGCTNLVGQYGTKYDSKAIDKTRAYVGEGGYLWGVPATTKKAYTVFNNGTQTFYYDDKKDSRPGNVDELCKGGDASWENSKSSINKVVFDSSFADFHITSILNNISFSGCTSLTSIQGLEYLNTRNMTKMSRTFYDCSSLTTLDLSSFNTENVTEMASMFYGCSSLTTLDLSSFNTENVTYMGDMFRYCTKLESIFIGKGWSTAKIEDRSVSIFGGENLVGEDGTTYDWNLSIDADAAHYNSGGLMRNIETKDTPISRTYAVFDNKTLTFYYDNHKNERKGTIYTRFYPNKGSWVDICDNIESVVFDPSFADFHKVTTTYGLFSNHTNLTSIRGLEFFNTENVKDMGYMFNGCSNLNSIDVSCFNTEEVTNLHNMFTGCSAITSLDLSGFNTNKVANIISMFRGCSNLKTIYVSNKWNLTKIRENIKDNYYWNGTFNDCDNLVGGDGTKVDHRYVNGDNAYAGVGGYLTLKSNELSTISDVTDVKLGTDAFKTISGESIDLCNIVINNAYFNIKNMQDNPTGLYDPADKCIIINKTTTNNEMQTVEASDLGSVDFIRNYTGMVLKVNGNGKIRINAQTVGNNKLAVKIGGTDAKTYTQATKGDITVNYDMTDDTYVYIYAVDANNQQQSISMDVTDTVNENAVKVYAVTVTPKVTAIETVSSTIPAYTYGKVYSIDGKQLTAPQKGLNILKMSDGTTRKVVK